jgi:ADP-heptose:LPS heptosyltransferase
MSIVAQLKPLIFRLTAALARPSASRPATPQRLLVIKPDHLGDLLLATPALRQLRNTLPEAHISGLVGPWAQRMWQGLTSLDELQTLAFPGFSRTPGRRSRLQTLRLTLQAAGRLRRGRYDTALLLRDDDYWSALVCTLAGIPRRIGMAHPKVVELLSDPVAYQADQHVTSQALAVVSRLGATGDSCPPLELVTTVEEQAWAAAQLPTAAATLICHPGTGGSAKQWPLSHWITLIDALQQAGLPVLLSGSPAEGGLIARIAAGCRRPPPLLAAELTIGRLAALFARARLVIGVDSGPLHIAVSSRTPTVHLFGPSDVQRFGPWGDAARHRVLRSQIFCSPCGSLERCPRATDPSECMVGITPSLVQQTVSSLLTDIT